MASRALEPVNAGASTGSTARRQCGRLRRHGVDHNCLRSGNTPWIAAKLALSRMMKAQPVY